MLRFSIIIPTYNVENYIEEMLNSLYDNDLSQTEIIVVDDGSQDSTVEKINKWDKEHNVQNFKLLQQKNSGVSRARNLGIEYAEGQYIIFCDGDDFCDKDLIQKITLHANRENDLLIWRYYIEQNKEKRISQVTFDLSISQSTDFLKHIFYEDYRIRIGSFAVSKDFLKQNGLSFSEKYAVGEDILFMYQALSQGKKIGLLNDALYTYRKREGSAMYHLNMRRFDAPRAIRELYKNMKLNTNLFDDKELENYVENTLFLQHSMYSFDAIIRYLKVNALPCFWKQYKREYKDVDVAIGMSCKQVMIQPKNVTERRFRLFKLSRKAYTYLFCIYQNLR